MYIFFQNNDMCDYPALDFRPVTIFFFRLPQHCHKEVVCGSVQTRPLIFFQFATSIVLKKLVVAQKYKKSIKKMDEASAAQGFQAKEEIVQTLIGLGFSRNAAIKVRRRRYGKCSKISNTSYLPKRPRQIGQTQIRLLLKKQSDQGLPYLLL